MENINVFTFEDVDENTISKIIDTLQSKTTCGSDGISMTQITNVIGASKVSDRFCTRVFFQTNSK